MSSTAESIAAQLVADVAGPLDVPTRPVSLPPDEDHGFGELTGYADRPPVPAPPGPRHGIRAGLGVLAAYADHATALPGTELLVERVLHTGRRRNAPWSVGGAFRMLPTLDGWFGLSLARDDDLELVPALVSAAVSGDPWAAVAAWLGGRTNAEASRRTELLGLPGAPVPAGPPPARRPPVLVEPGGARHRTARPLVVDLSVLWAGPLCSRLLRRAGARVVSIVSTTRPDTSRDAAPGFHAALHDGEDVVRLDLATERQRLHALVAAADVVVEGSRPRALRELGLDAAAEVARGAVWTSITAYGRGPGDELRVGFGDDVAAGAGIVAWHRGIPLPVGDAVADPLAGVHAAAATAIALHAGRGVLLDVSMHDVARSLTGGPTH